MESCYLHVKVQLINQDLNEKTPKEESRLAGYVQRMSEDRLSR